MPVSPEGFNGQGVAHAHGVAPVGCRVGSGRAAAQRLRRRLPRTEATPEGLEEHSVSVAQCHSPGDAGCGEEEDEGWGRGLRRGTSYDALNYAAGSGDTDRTAHCSTRELCSRCEAIADGIDKTYRNGRLASWRRLGAPTRYQRSTALMAMSRCLDADVDYDASDLDQAKGGPSRAVPAQQGHLQAFQLRCDGRVAGAWAHWIRSMIAARGCSDCCSSVRHCSLAGR